jgi:hypothetical protein
MSWLNQPAQIYRNKALLPCHLQKRLNNGTTAGINLWEHFAFKAEITILA